MRSIPASPYQAMTEALASIPQTPGYQVCTRCVMDTTHKEIFFDDQGVCNYCHGYDLHVASRKLDPAQNRATLERKLAQIKRDGKKHEYDCILGVSGGVDSSYLALKCKEWGLRVLLVQFDNGWNTELANHNIQSLCETLGFDLHTHVVDWAEFRDLQLSFIKAGLANVEGPSDHGIFACLYRTARNRGIKWLLSGVNNATEASFPLGEKAKTTFSYGYRYSDLKHLKAVHRKFGKIPLKTFPTLGFFSKESIEKLRLLKRFDPLNVMPYNKAEAINTLKTKTDWKPYPGKHFESVITRFHQSYILPVKFGMDKRRLHLSGLVWSQQSSRADALAELSRPPIQESLLRQDYEFVAKKFQLTSESFNALIASPPKTYSDYPNYNWLYQTYPKLTSPVRLLRSLSTPGTR